MGGLVSDEPTTANLEPCISIMDLVDVITQTIKAVNLHCLSRTRLQID